jgi:hypothetical protein
LQMRIETSPGKGMTAPCQAHWQEAGGPGSGSHYLNCCRREAGWWPPRAPARYPSARSLRRHQWGPSRQGCMASVGLMRTCPSPGSAVSRPVGAEPTYWHSAGTAATGPRACWRVVASQPMLKVPDCRVLVCSLAAGTSHCCHTSTDGCQAAVIQLQPSQQTGVSDPQDHMPRKQAHHLTTEAMGGFPISRGLAGRQVWQQGRRRRGLLEHES